MAFYQYWIKGVINADLVSFAYTEMRSQINLLEPANPDKIFDQIKFLLFNGSHTGIAKSTEINQHLVEEVQSIEPIWDLFEMG